jgi:hypothetical protein
MQGVNALRALPAWATLVSLLLPGDLTRARGEPPVPVTHLYIVTADRQGIAGAPEDRAAAVELAAWLNELHQSSVPGIDGVYAEWADIRGKCRLNRVRSCEVV